ncbi:hypothetical protein BK655_12365 [Pseudomonas brassicacearum]|uniref:hypothetical protein n=1 Tax=Pseudomonas brassicacearum TaxID=930166 RepID=UPI000F4A3404|nr:hypothetical protein [Pseudomonas brassicacearum]ROM84137.1 hypothetical protein BK655_12365 [Pseudomonas brassicacearum]
MSQHDELKQLAEACGDFNWRAIQENWCEWAIRDDHAYIATMRTKSAKHAGPCPDRETKAKFLCAATPAAIKTLIAENERLSGECEGCPMQVAEELRAEIAGLKTGYQAYELVNAELKAEVEKLRGVMACVVNEVPHHENRNGNAPGHCHSIPGVWDQSNGAKSGTECGWCKVWNTAVAMSKGEQS